MGRGNSWARMVRGNSIYCCQQVLPPQIRVRTHRAFLMEDVEFRAGILKSGLGGLAGLRNPPATPTSPLFSFAGSPIFSSELWAGPAGEQSSRGTQISPQISPLSSPLPGDKVDIARGRADPAALLILLLCCYSALSGLLLLLLCLSAAPFLLLLLCPPAGPMLLLPFYPPAALLPMLPFCPPAAILLLLPFCQ